MKALSLRQPWANAVLYLGKTIENRRWNTHFRGKFLIHASKTMTDEDNKEAMAFAEDVLGAGQACRIVEAMGKWGASPPLRFGGIVGVATLVRVIPPCETGEPSLFWRPCEHAWHIPEQYGFVLEDVREVPFVPYKGSLNFFDVPQAIVDAVGV